MKKFFLLLIVIFSDSHAGENDASASAAQILQDTRPFYLEPSSIYHAFFKRAIYGFENGWAQTYDFYEKNGEFDENDCLRSTYARFCSVTFKAHNIRFGDYNRTIEIFKEFESIIDSFAATMGDANHPLLAFIYLNYMVFINKCTVSSNVSLLCLQVDKVICFLESKWKTQDNEPTDSIAFLQAEAFKVRGMLYSHSANSLLKKMQSAGEGEKRRLEERKREDITLSEQSLREAETRALDQKQKEIIQKHWDTLEQQRNREEQRPFGRRTTDYVERVNEYLRTNASYIHKLDDRLLQTDYFPIAQTQIAWFRPIIRFQEEVHRPPVFQQQATAASQQQGHASAAQPQENHECRCIDCIMVRSELDRCAGLAFSEIQSEDHFSFVLGNLVTAMDLFWDYQAYIDSNGKILLLEILAKVLSWQGFLEADTIAIFQSIQDHLRELQ